MPMQESGERAEAGMRRNLPIGETNFDAFFRSLDLNEVGH